MAQSYWATTTSGDYTFFTDADAALISYLKNNAPNGLAGYLNAYTIRRNVLDQPMYDESKTTFPVVHVWTDFGDSEFHAAPSVPVRVQTRFTIWDLDADVDTMAQQVQGICGALSAAVQQTPDTSGNDWADWYCNWGLPNATVGSIDFIEAGEDVLFCRGTVIATWTHNE